MDPSSDGGSYDASKGCKLSLDEKRELVYELSKWSGAPEVLQSWSRQDILQVLCAEMGKERKYTGLTKLKIIDHLLRIVTEKLGERSEAKDLEAEAAAPTPVLRSIKRPRKADYPSQLPLQVNHPPSNNSASDLGNTIYCKNSACKATLRQEDAFCKRCSCCICHQYDDNKDPSLWLICSSEPPFYGVACGMSCHLECALKHEASGIGKVNDSSHSRLDGSFRCAACGKVNDLLGCWRKQLVTARDTRRVDILYYRLSLTQKLMSGTVKYQKLHEIVVEAVKKLEADVGPLIGIPVKMGRGIVNRLSSGPEVQKLCTSALESLNRELSSISFQTLTHSNVQDFDSLSQTKVVFEEVSATSIAVFVRAEEPFLVSVVGYKLWHRKGSDTYQTEPTKTLFAPNSRFTFTGLSPATDYHFKVISFNDTRELSTCEVWCPTYRAQDEIPKCLERSQSPATNCSSLSNPSSVEDESNHNVQCSDQILNGADNYLGFCKSSDNSNPHLLSNGASICGGTGEKVIAAHATPLLDEEQARTVVGSTPNSKVQKLQSKCLMEGKMVEGVIPDNGADTLVMSGMECMPFTRKSDTSLPVTPCKLEISKDVQGRIARSKSSNKDQSNGMGHGAEPQDGSTSKKRSGERQEEECTANDHSDRDLEYYVKVIRWLECEGHLDKNFRQKFLTWYSLRATAQEIRVVKAFVDTLIDDPASLAEQLVDTFSDCVSSRISSVVPSGLCMKLWH